MHSWEVAAQMHAWAITSLFVIICLTRTDSGSFLCSTAQAFELSEAQRRALEAAYTARGYGG